MRQKQNILKVVILDRFLQVQLAAHNLLESIRVLSSEYSIHYSSMVKMGSIITNYEQFPSFAN